MSNNITEIPALFPTCVPWRIHWDKIDAGVNWVAVDGNGKVWGYKSNPKRFDYVFSSTDNIETFLFKIEERPDFATLIFSRPK